MIQLDMLETEEETLIQQFQKVKETSDSVRRAVFARVNELEKIVRDLQEKLVKIEPS